MKTLLLFLAACGTTTSTPSTPAVSKPAWQAGVGVPGCALHATAAQCFPGETAETDPANVQLAMYPKRGVAIFVDGDTVEHVYVRYHYANTAPFEGAGDRGIGASSKRADVEKAFGAGTIDEGGRLVYADRGLSFMFDADGTLAWVGIAPATIQGR